MFKRKVSASLKMLSDSNIRVHTVNDRLLKELSQKRLGSSQINKVALQPIKIVNQSNQTRISQSSFDNKSEKRCGGPSQVNDEQCRIY